MGTPYRPPAWRAHDEALSDMRQTVLRAQHAARQLQTSTRSEYAALHYEEVEAQAKLMLVQLEYAALAERNEPRRQTTTL